MKPLMQLSFLTLTILPLQAQSRFGLEIGNTIAQGDLRDGLRETKDGRVGGILGATFRLHNFQPGGFCKESPGDLAIRLRASAVAYPEHSKPNTGVDVTGTSLNLEVVHTFGKDFTGFQVIGGGGLAHWERQSAALTQATDRPVTTIGVGWQWRYVGVEARWNVSSFSKQQSANSIDTVVSFRF